MIGSIIWGIIGARLYYTIFNFKEYFLDPIKLLEIRDGGLAIYGAFISIIIFLIIKCKKSKVNFFNLVDYLIPYFALGQSIGRWGNFFNQEAYGSRTNSILRMGIKTIGDLAKTDKQKLINEFGKFRLYHLEI